MNTHRKGGNCRAQNGDIIKGQGRAHIIRGGKGDDMPPQEAGNRGGHGKPMPAAQARNAITAAGNDQAIKHQNPWGRIA